MHNNLICLLTHTQVKKGTMIGAEFEVAMFSVTFDEELFVLQSSPVCSGNCTGNHP
jgi:hypothetical protein